MKYTLPLFLAVIIFSSCKKDKSPDLTNALLYAETQCSDPWTKDVERGDNFAGRLKTWLETKTSTNITKPYIKYAKEKVEVCYACSCTTGNTIYVWPPAGSEQKFLDLGFRKP